MHSEATNSFHWIPESASTGASSVDAIFYALFWMTVVLCVLIFGAIALFSIRYRNGARTDRRLSGRYHQLIEITWTVIPTIVGLGIFAWAARVYVTQNRIPKDGLEIYVVAKQWMWKLQHADGPREINELHVPVGTPVKLLMTSQDVIHSFFVPEFRSKRDVLPGRFEGMWFQATKPGTYHLFCAEYCGTQHSKMIGRIVVLNTNEYAVWSATFAPTNSPSIAGAKLFQQLACNSCHTEVDTERGPTLAKLYGKTIRLTDGKLCEANEDYISHSILNPSAQIATGYGPTMPNYADLDQEKIVTLVAYIKSLTQGNDGHGPSRKDVVVSTREQTK